MSLRADYRRYTFGDSPEMADTLLALVLKGRKTATCWAAVHGTQAIREGGQYIVQDGQGRDRALLETIELTRRRFSEVDAAFARDEGEGSRTLKAWRAGHEAYFRAENTFDPDMLLWCERFKLVKILDESAS